MAARRTIYGLLLGILAGIPMRAGVNRWTSDTPAWGPDFVLGVAVHPGAPGVVFARGEGLWRSDDGGAHWRRLPVPQRLVLTVAPDPNSGDVIYVDRSAGGILRTTDGGTTWTSMTAPGTSPPVVHQLTIAPSAPETLFAYAIGPESGLYRSRDSGATWRIVLPSIPFVGVAVDPFDARKVYIAAGDQGVLRSTNGGDLWVPSNTGLLTLSAVSIAIDPRDARHLYLVNGSLIYRSTDGGGTWQTAASGVANLLEVLSVPGLANAAFARTGPSQGVEAVLRTTNGGFTWSTVPLPPGVATLNGMAPDPARVDGLYVVTDLVVKTANAGTSWTTLGQGPAQIGARALSVSPFEPATVYAAGGLERISFSSNAGRTWLSPENASFPSASTNNLAIAPTTPETVYAGTASGLFRTLNRGATWSRVGPFTDSARILLGAGQDDRLIAVTTGCDRLVDCPPESSQSTDGGATWQAIHASDGGPVFARLLAGTVPPTLLGTADVGRKFVRGDPAGPLASVPGAPTLELLAADPFEPSVIYGVGTLPGGGAGHFFRSRDAGSTWSAVGPMPDETILAFVIDPLNPTHAAVGTDSSGIFQSTDGGATWEPWSEDLAESHIEALAFSSDGRTLYAGTEHAVYQYTFCEPCRRGDAQRSLTQTVPARPLAPGE